MYLFYPISSLFSLARSHAPSISNYSQLFKVLCFLAPCFCRSLYQPYLPRPRLRGQTPLAVEMQFRGAFTVKPFLLSPRKISQCSVLFCPYNVLDKCPLLVLYYFKPLICLYVCILSKTGSFLKARTILY